jgi:hypothetical protein
MISLLTRGAKRVSGDAPGRTFMCATATLQNCQHSRGGWRASLIPTPGMPNNSESDRRGGMSFLTKRYRFADIPPIDGAGVYGFSIVDPAIRARYTTVRSTL